MSYIVSRNGELCWWKTVSKDFSKKTWWMVCQFGCFVFQDVTIKIMILPTV